MNTRADTVRELLAAKARKLSLPVRLMEVCGSHSFAIARAGIRDLLPEGVRLLSGPGCPVCVSGEKFLEQAILLARRGVRVAVFGDLLRIPAGVGTLGEEKGIQVIYSPEEVLRYASENPEREVVFAAVGFAPTLAAAAAVLEQAEKMRLENFSMLCDFKNIRPVLDLLADDDEFAPDGFLLPGHVAAIIGEKGFAGLTRPGVIAGFSPENIIGALGLLLDAVAEGKNRIVNHYPSAVRREGSEEALKLIDCAFEPGPGEWRGIGFVPDGNWRIGRKYERFDAEKKYDFPAVSAEGKKPSACRCGEVLRGRIMPDECGLFGTVCQPRHPAGACMVSAEGACAAAWNYRKHTTVNGTESI